MERTNIDRTNAQMRVGTVNAQMRVGTVNAQMRVPRDTDRTGVCGGDDVHTAGHSQLRGGDPATPP